MKKFYSLIVMVLLVSGIMAAQGKAKKATEPVKAPAAAPTLQTEKERTSYAIGCDIGNLLKQAVDEIDLDIIILGIKDITVLNKEQIPLAERQKLIMDFSQKMNKKMEEKRKIQGEKNKVEGEAYLKTNGTKPGVKTTASGLQYEIIKEGTGATPKMGDQIKAHYKGSLIDGKEFDNSYNRNEPIVFPLEGVIPAWQEGLQLMKAGAIYRFVVPSSLAYQDKGSGMMIGPNAVLIFEVELLGVENPPPPPPAPTSEPGKPVQQPEKK